MGVWIDHNGIKHPESTRAWIPPPRRAVCRRCGLVMVDCEPMMTNGEFYHRPYPTKHCINSGHTFALYTPKHFRSIGYGMHRSPSVEIVPFLRKRDRRSRKRGARLAHRACVGGA